MKTMSTPSEAVIYGTFQAPRFLLGTVHCPDFSEHGELLPAFALGTDKIGITTYMAVRSFHEMVVHAFSVVCLDPVVHMYHDVFLCR